MRAVAILLVVLAGSCSNAHTNRIVAVVNSREILQAELLPSDTMVAKEKSELSPKEFEKWRKSFPVERLVTLIKTPIIEQYKKDNKLAATDAELAAYLVRSSQGEQMLRSQAGKKFFTGIVESRKVGKSLFEKYGGRVSISSFGFVVPIDAEAKLLREKMNQKIFSIRDEELAEAFWAKVSQEWGDATLTEAEARDMFNAADYLPK